MKRRQAEMMDRDAPVFGVENFFLFGVRDDGYAMAGIGQRGHNRAQVSGNAATQLVAIWRFSCYECDVQGSGRANLRALKTK